VYDGSAGRVLVLDSNAHVRRLVTTLLSGLFLESVVHARSLSDLTAASFSPHLMIIDWPSDPTEVILLVHRIRSGDLFTPRMPILAMSAHMHHSVLEHAWQNRIDDVIAKPISAVELIKRSAALLDEHWTWKPSADNMAAQ